MGNLFYDQSYAEGDARAMKDVKKETLQQLVYRRSPQQAFSEGGVVQRRIDDAKAGSTGPDSKHFQMKVQKSQTPALNAACLEFFRKKVESEKCFLALPTPVFRKLQGTPVATAVVSSFIPSSLPAPPPRGHMAISAMSSLALTDAPAPTSAVSFCDDDDRVEDVSRADVPGRDQPGCKDGEVHDDSLMTIFRIVHVQPNRLKRPLRAKDALTQTDVAICQYRILESCQDEQRCMQRVRVARAHRPLIAATSLFEKSMDIEELCRTMVQFKPANSCVECLLSDSHEHSLVLAMAKAGAFPGKDVYYHEDAMDGDVELWFALQQRQA